MVEKARAAMLAESRKLNTTCGCEKRGARQFSCDYHEGMDDGFEYGSRFAESAVREAVSECANEVEAQFPGPGGKFLAAALRKKYGVGE